MDAQAARDGGRRRAVVVASILALAAVAALLAVLTTWQRDVAPPGAEGNDPSAGATRWPLTGLPADGDVTGAPLAVKVSNSPEARPQTGLMAADVVVEELTEGGVTRFLAVYHSRLPEVVGPVRSARPVDVQLLSGLGQPGFVYSGARAEVRELLERSPAVLVSEGAPGVFRDAGAYASHPVAPHNLFVHPQQALTVAVDRGAGPLRDPGWRFADQPPAGGEQGERIEVPMSPAYRSVWIHEPTTGHYRLEQAGGPVRTTDGGEVTAANVVVLRVRHYVGASGYPETDVVGAGDAVVLRDGLRYPARWSKPTEADPLQLLTPEGEPVALRPGTSWIHLPDRLPD
jgi:hypothetical protein